MVSSYLFTLTAVKNLKVKKTLHVHLYELIFLMILTCDLRSSDKRLITNE